MSKLSVHTPGLLRFVSSAMILILILVGMATPPRPVFAQSGDAIPLATLSAPNTVPIGEAFSFAVTFVNGSTTQTGYGPFIDLIFPATGADGDDGITFVDANYLGAPVTTVSLTFPGTDPSSPPSCVAHPYARLQDGSFQQVCGTPGDTLVVLQLPFGSFTPGQPAVELTVNAQLSVLADLDVPLTIRARGGFQFGNTPLDDWCCDEVLLNPASGDSADWPEVTVAPVLMSLTKTYLGPEDETATGPNFPRRYRIDVDLADGQTVTDLVITDILTTNIAFVNLIPSTPAGATVLVTPTVGAPALNNELQIRFPTVTGGSGDVDASVVFEFFVPRLDANGDPVLDPSTADDATAPNNARATATWEPVDERDPEQSITIDGPGPEHTLTPKAIAIQKSVEVAIGNFATGPKPGDTLAYTLSVQVSDFFAFNTVVISDTFSDGQRFDQAFTPTLQINGNGFTSDTASFALANFTVTPNYTPEVTVDPDGTTTITFRVSDELVSRGLSDGRLLGGCVPLAGSDEPDCDVYDNGPTTATIVFRTVIQDEFSDDFPSGDKSVDEGDVLSNQVTVRGDVLDTATFDPTDEDEEDGSSAAVVIPRGLISKTIYAINGDTDLPSPLRIAPGDTVTYRLQTDLPASRVEELRLVDYLPLPIFRADEMTGVFSNTVSADPPPAGQAKYGPNETFDTLFAGVPQVITDTVANSVIFRYGNYPSNDAPIPDEITPSVIDILFTVTASDEPTADRLFLTNQFRRLQGATNQPQTSDDAIVQIEMTQPVLRVSKGATGSNNPDALLSQNAGPVPFGGPGSSVPFTGTINSTNLITAPVDATLNGVDANDLVSFAILIENTGSSLKGAFDLVITDTLPFGLIIPTDPYSLNLQVRYGTGEVISYTGDLFGNGIELIDPSGDEGVCQVYDPSSGNNIILITYDLQVDPDIPPNTPIVNRATLVNYAGDEGGPNHASDLTASTTVTSASPNLVKSLVTTSEAHTTGTDVVIGEIARFRLAVRVPEGQWSEFQIRDVLPPGLTYLTETARFAFVSNGAGMTTTLIADGVPTIIGNSATLTETPSISITGVFSPSNVVTSTNSVTFNFGTLVNRDSDVDAEYVIVEFNALVENLASNQQGTNLPNRFQVLRDGEVVPTSSGAENSNTVTLRVIEPSLTLAKAIVNPADAEGDAGDFVTYRITVTNTSPTTGFDLVIADPVPAGLSFDIFSPPNITETGGVTNTVWSFDNPSSTLIIETATFSVGAELVIEYQVQVETSVIPAQQLTNTAILTWTSLPDLNGTTTNPTGSPNTGTPGERDGERTGSGGVNDYRTSDDATLTVFVPVPEKSLVATSEGHTSDEDAEVAIGEIVRYRLAVELPEGTSPSLQLVDLLPAGLTYLTETARVAFVSNDDGITSTLPLDIPNLIGSAATITAVDSGLITGTLRAEDVITSTGLITFNLGTLVNYDSDPDAEYVIVEFNALVENIPANVAGFTHVNTFIVRIAGTQVGPPSNEVNTTVVEPAITVDKQVISPADATIDAGDLISYRVTYTNTGTTDAFDVQLTDTLPATLQLLTNTVAITPSGGIIGANDASSGNTVEVSVDQMPPNEGIVLTYEALALVTVTPGEIITNTAYLTYTSLLEENGTPIGDNPTGSETPGEPGAIDGERTGSGTPAQNNYNDSDDARVEVPLVALVKTLVTTSEAHTSDANVAIGEIVRYRLAVELPEGTSPSLQLVDLLPAGLTYLTETARVAFVSNDDGITSTLPLDIPNLIGSAATITAVDSGLITGTLRAEDVITSTGLITFNLGTLVNRDDDPDAEYVIVEFNALVDNNNTDAASRNDDGDVRTNRFRVFINGTQNGLDSNEVSVTIVEPRLVLDKRIVDPPSDAGDLVTYLVTYTNTGTTDAFEVQLTDALPPELTLSLPVTPTLSGGATGLSDASSGNVVSVTVTSVPVGGSVAITYTAIVTDAVSGGQIITNTARLVYTSLPGTNGTPDNPTGSTTPGAPGSTTGERDGSDGADGRPNNYSQSASTSTTLDAAELSKVLAGTSLADTTGSNVTIGEIVTYTLTITLPEGLTPSLVLTDTLPSGMAYVTGTLITDTTGFNGTLPAANVTAAGGNGDPVILTWGAITVTPDNDPTNNSFRVQLQARVLDVSGNSGLTPQTTLTNRASLVAGNNPPVTSNPVNVTVVEPRLVIDKQFSQPTAYAGETVTVTLIVTNTGTSTAYDVVIIDPLPQTQFSDVQEGTTPSGFTYTTSISGSDTVVRYTGGDIPAAASRTFTFAVTLDADLDAGTILSNTATITRATSLPGPDPTERNQPETSDDDPITIVAPDLAITKTDGGATAVPGGLITFTLHYTNLGTIGVTGVTITETVPLHTRFAGPAGWLCDPDNTAGSTCLFTVGDLAAGASGSESFVVRVDNPLPVGVNEVVNAARIGDDGANGPDPDLRNNETDETTPIIFPPISLGNRVFYDTNNDGLDNDGAGATLGSSTGVPSVTVQLFLDADRDGQLTGDEQIWIAETTTDADGFYLFTEQTHRDGAVLTATLPLYPGQYVIGIPAIQFATGAALAGYHSSGTTIDATGVITETSAPDPNNQVDRDDNGTLQLPLAPFFDGGVLSQPVMVVATQAPTGEPEEAGVAPNSVAILDENSDLTIDFGFYTTSLGNLVWLDDGGSTPANALNGFFDAGETGLAGVAVRLFSGDGATEIPVGPDGILGTDDDANLLPVLTLADGRYQLRGLPQGSYRVQVTPPLGYVSTLDTAGTNDPNTNVDQDDNGPGRNSGAVTSNPVTITPGNAGSQNNTLITTTLGLTADPTVDFGFVRYFSLGNRVWYDRDNSGDLNAADGANPGLDEVLVRLLDRDGNAVTDASGNPVADQRTSGGGYYRFDNLLAGDYLVEVVAENFTDDGVLVQFLSSTGPAQEADPNENGDNNDNGLDTPVNGAIRSGLVTLGPGADEPTNDNDPTTNPEPGEAPNDRSNRTVDFGFFRPVSVGNQVWYDTNNNRQIDANEVGIPGVRVELFFDADGNGILEDNRDTGGVDETQPVSFTTTITDGLYLFTTRPDALGNLQLLTPGSYVVGIPASEFDPITGTLRGLFSSGTTLTSAGVRTEIAPPDPKTDRTDGDDNGAFQTSGFYAGGVLAQAVTLEPGAEPVGEDPDLDPNPAYRPDNSDNQTLDFGFYGMSLGNLVWLDNGAGGGTANDGLRTGSEPGIADVTVRLFAADGRTELLTTTTDVDGRYLFTGLVEGTYIVEVDRTSPPVLGLASSRDPVNANDPNAQDNDDNGVLLTTTTVRSIAVALVANAAPTGESDQALTRDPGMGNPAQTDNPFTPDQNANLHVDFGFAEADWGDLPENIPGLPSYNTTRTGGSAEGPSHAITPGLRIGAAIDAERDGQPNATATGDDLNGILDDEDGVTLPAFVTGLPATVTVQVLNITGRPATLYGFIDFNGDGTFDQPGERASVAVPNGSDGSVEVVFDVPVTATLATPIGVRFRLSTDSGLGPDGPASDGEVEDYLVNITPTYSLGNRVWYDRDNSGDLNAADGANPGLAGVMLRLLDAEGNPVTDATGRLVTATTDISGYYRFDNLLAGDYLVEVEARNFADDGPLFTMRSSTGPAQEADPNDDVDNNDNGLDTPVNGAIRSGIVTLGPGNSEPTDDNDPVTNPEPGEAPNDRSNRTVDFGFFIPPDLAITKTDGGATAVPGGLITFTLHYTNLGTIGATGVTITETVPPHTSFAVAANVAGWLCEPDTTAGSTCVFTVGDLAAGASGSVAFVVQVDNPLPAGVTAVVNAVRIGDDGTNGPDPNDENNTDTETTPVRAAPDLAITKTDGGATAVPGGLITFTLHYTNLGTIGATGVTITETVPP
ncbi:SdrD B-like domain-containing protein, partial [Candidatus Chloroploca asiatica]